MPTYEHTQIGYVTGGTLLTAAAVTYLSSRSEGAQNWWSSASALGLAAGAFLFSSLTVRVTEKELRFYFGPGVWEQHIPLDDIQDAEIVRNPLSYGWGIRYTFPGWLYNVSGRDAVELDLRGKEPVRIGTDEPEALKQALAKAKSRSELRGTN